MSFIKLSTKNRLPLLVVTIIVIILFFGLRPKKWTSTNNIHWLPQQKALEFRSQSMAYVANLGTVFSNQNLNEFTIQLPVTPANTNKQGFRPILLIHNGEDRQQLAIWQWGTSLIVMNGNDYDYSMRTPRISVNETLYSGKESLITITSNEYEDRVFINGSLVKKTRKSQLTIPDTHKKLRLILGNSVYAKHSWEGIVYGLALNGRALSTKKITFYYEKWRDQRNLSFNKNDKPLLLYTFNHNETAYINNGLNHSQALVLPKRLLPLKRTFLSFSRNQFKPNFTSLFDVILNLIGFIPVGAIICCWSSQSQPLPRKLEFKLILTFCFILSLSIEIIQVWLPYRDSNILDLMLNTLGGGLGVLLFHKFYTSKKQIDF